MNVGRLSRYILLSVVALSSCADEPIPFEPTFSSVRQHLFDVHCVAAGCHAAGSAESGLDLESLGTYERLVNQPGTGIPSILLVAPGHPEQSYLMHKLEGSGIVGERMPMGKLVLADSTIELVRKWISGGAKKE